MMIIPYGKIKFMFQTTNQPKFGKSSIAARWCPLKKDGLPNHRTSFFKAPKPNTEPTCFSINFGNELRAPPCGAGILSKWELMRKHGANSAVCRSTPLLP